MDNRTDRRSASWSRRWTHFWISIGRTMGAAICSLLFLATVPGPLGVKQARSQTIIPFSQTGTWSWSDRDFWWGSGHWARSNELWMDAAGDDVYETSSYKYDRRDFYYLNNVPGNWTVQVEVVSQQGDNNQWNGGGSIDDWAKAGIMVKNQGVSAEDDPSQTGYCIVAVTPGNGVVMQWDSDQDGFLDSTVGTGAGTTVYPVGLKLIKSGANFTGYYSTDGTNWTQIGQAAVTLYSTNTAQQDLGVFVCSGNHSMGTTVHFNTFQFTQSSLQQSTITVTAGSNGSITPSGDTNGDVLVNDGDGQTFTVTPDQGYEVTQVLVDGSPVTLTGNQHTFTDVTADHTIEVSFNIITNTITATAGSNGSITPASGVAVNYGADQSFTVTPDTGYQVATFQVDGVNQTLPAGNTWDFTDVISDHTINVTFVPQTFTITATAGSNGSIDPGGGTTVDYGTNQTYTVTPDTGYQVDSVLVDGSPAALTDGQYTFTNVTASHTIAVTFTNNPAYVETTVPGCDVSVSSNYSSGFDAADFHLTNLAVQNGQIVLQTGVQAIDPNNIVIPFKQQVAVTFIYEGAGHVSDFGYVLYKDCINPEGAFKGWNNIPLSARHPIFHNIVDQVETGGCCGGGNGVLDSTYGNGNFPTKDEAALATYDDGTGLPFTVDGDGVETPKDMRKVLGTFDAGTQLVFFLTANEDWTTMDPSHVFFSKQAWNPDHYTVCMPPAGDSPWINGGPDFIKSLDLGSPRTEDGCYMEDGWLAQPAIDRLNSIFGITLSGTADLTITDNGNFPHVVVGAPVSDPNQWILGFEDMTNGGDADYNDMVFRIERKTGGVAQLKSEDAIKPAGADDYYTAITVSVYDDMPCSGKSQITYYLSIDNGKNWVQVTNWDVVKEEDCATEAQGAVVTNGTPGSPACTYRSVRIDFAALGISGNQFIWKAVMESQHENCIPKVLNVEVNGDVATHGSFSRASPINQANVLYSGSYETPAVEWVDKVPRGHLIATRLYDPGDPSKTAAQQIRDAGAVMNSMDPSARNIYYPSITTTAVTNEVVGTGDGSQTTFTGTLSHHPISATTVSITDTVEVFTDAHTNDLIGSLGGTGTVNRFTGAFSMTFNRPPGNGVKILASYTYYITSSTLTPFTPTNVTNAMLGLNDQYVEGKGYTYDLNNDGAFTEADGDWLVNWVRGYKDGVSVKKEWLLGAIDHSVPALETPPGTPIWYFGTQVPDSEKTSYDAFKKTEADRPAAIYVGARDGMLHAVDAGEFRWGDNPDTPDIKENRGYFVWKDSTHSASADYGTGNELWAFTPANLLPRLKNNLLQGDDRAMVDASPTLADVLIDPQGTGTKTWHTVLLCAEGNGGDTVFCLDVTDPINPTFLWEFSDPDLFRRRSSPAVAQTGRIVVDGQTRWAAFFASGKSNDPAMYPSIYWVDIANGSVIQRIFLTAEVSGGPSGAGGVPSGQPAIVDSDSNGYIDRIYIGTDKGYLYKVNIPDDPNTVNYGITQCVINQNFDYVDSSSTTQTVPSALQYQPIYASPVALVDNQFSKSSQISYRVRIFFGTCDSPDYDEAVNAANTPYYFYAYLDEADKGECTADTSKLDWFYELPAGNRVFASAFAAAGQVYFGTATAGTDDPCAAQAPGANAGQIYAFSVGGGPPVFQSQVGNIVSAPLVQDQHLYYRTTTGLTSLGSGSYNSGTILGGTPTSKQRSWKELF